MRDALRHVPLFEDLLEDDLARLAAGAQEERAGPGEVVFREGDTGDRAFVIVDGEIEVVKASGDREVLLAVRGPGDVIGEMALLDAAPRMASVRARTDVRFVTIPKDVLDDLLGSSATASRSLFRVLLARWRETEAKLRQSERMAQIGTLTAGLAHEMNNPAAAVSRGAGQLGPAVDGLAAAIGDLRARGIDPATDDLLSALFAAAHGTPEPLGALERSDREAALDTVLTELGVGEAWRLAPVLVAAGIEPDPLRSATADLTDGDAGAVVEALGAAAEVAALVREVDEGAARLSAIVAALKSYSYLDRDAVLEIDVRGGLDDTLLILKQKLDGIDVTRDYPDDPVTIQAHAGELNQVWTNLIDNAADALAEAGTPAPSIVVRVREEDGGAVVEVEDNGPGIPAEIRDRVFDAFFTTKPPGSGTGLGLDISYGIVVHRHRGEITVESEPGRTVFRVTLPGDPD